MFAMPASYKTQMSFKLGTYQGVFFYLPVPHLHRKLAARIPLATLAQVQTLGAGHGNVMQVFCFEGV